ncbi:hypothetical protein HD554DRAFT_871970 [Boletus coccyginus]|nr:hypothetical protein HD554DRAFT_871970 [Boletus coccyginus]
MLEDRTQLRLLPSKRVSNQIVNLPGRRYKGEPEPRPVPPLTLPTLTHNLCLSNGQTLLFIVTGVPSMSPEMQSTLELLQTNAYVSLAIVTAVLYDYALTISSEVQYVWHQTWTWVSTLFVLIRYFGLLSTIILGLCVLRVKFGDELS